MASVKSCFIISFSILLTVVASKLSDGSYSVSSADEGTAYQRGRILDDTPVESYRGHKQDEQQAVFRTKDERNLAAKWPIYERKANLLSMFKPVSRSFLMKTHGHFGAVPRDKRNHKHDGKYPTDYLYKTNDNPESEDIVEDNPRMSKSLTYYPFREKRPFEVDQIECPPTNDAIERFACPSPDSMGRYLCIDDHVLCDGYFDCPGAEDEDGKNCLFYKTTKAHLDVLADALLRWARGR